MAEDRGVGAAGVLQGVGQDGKSIRVEVAARQGTLVIRSIGQGRDVRRQPGGVDGGGPERVGEGLVEEARGPPARLRDPPVEYIGEPVAADVEPRRDS